MQASYKVLLRQCGLYKYVDVFHSFHLNRHGTCTLMDVQTFLNSVLCFDFLPPSAFSSRVLFVRCKGVVTLTSGYDGHSW